MMSTPNLSSLASLARASALETKTIHLHQLVKVANFERLRNGAFIGNGVKNEQSSIGNVIIKISQILLSCVRMPSKSTVTIAILSALLIRAYWEKWPPWIRQGFLSFFRIRKRKESNDSGAASVINGHNNDADDDGLLATVQKIQNVLKLANKKLEGITDNNRPEAKLDIFQQQMALLTSFLLVQQVEEKSGDLWDKWHENAGTQANLSLSERNNLVKFLRFADWAYIEETDDIRQKLQDVNCALLRHFKMDEPGRVGHFVALDSKAKIALVCVKGTSSFADMVTDACGTPVRYTLKDGPFLDGGPTTISCHEGILDAARDLADDIQPLVEQLFIPSGYKIMLTGHSLGAGVAALVGAILRSRVPNLKKKGNDLLEVLIFAPPPVVNLAAATAMSSYTTSIVNNVDVVPRASINNAVTLVRFLDIIYDKLNEKGLAPTNPKAALNILRKLIKEDSETIISPSELFTRLSECQDQDDLYDMDHLYIPGKVLFMYKKIGQELEKQEVSDGNQTTTNEMLLSVGAIETDGSCSVLRHIDIDKRMISEHFTVSYEQTLMASWPS